MINVGLIFFRYFFVDKFYNLELDRCHVFHNPLVGMILNLTPVIYNILLYTYVNLRNNFSYLNRYCLLKNYKNS